MPSDESKFYDMTCQAIQELFELHSYSTDFEVIGGRGKCRVPVRFLKTKALQKYASQLPTPDIMGLVKKGTRESNLVLVEFKSEPRYRDIFQTKGYNELYRSDFTFLISREPMFKSSKKTLDFVRHDHKLLRVRYGRRLYIMFLHKTSEGKITLAQSAVEVGAFEYPDLDL